MGYPVLILAGGPDGGKGLLVMVLAPGPGQGSRLDTGQGGGGGNLFYSWLGVGQRVPPCGRTNFFKFFNWLNNMEVIFSTK